MLQNNCKRDPESYRSEFALQWTHYQALMELFALKPDQKSPEFADMVHFLSHVSKCYKEIILPFSQNMYELLDKHVDVLHPQLRMQLLQALMHMRHQGLIEAEALLALCFRLFQCHDKALKAALHSFIVQDIKLANSRGRNDRLNKSVQNYMYKIIELWRRQIWRDARTVNVIASATAHKSTSVMLAALKFFLGQDLASEVEDGDKEAEEAEATNVAEPSKSDVYRTYHKGTPTSKKKKLRKLKRVVHTLEKSKRRGAANQADSFAALQLLHDAQTFAERLFSRLQARGHSFETRLVIMQVVSRAIGVHELQLDNFYPFMMRYLKPSQRDVVAVLAAVVQACHKLVSPEAVRPVLLQLVDQFVHDRARPEVMTVGLKTVRELCIRCPLVMDEALLSDLALYKKEKDKHVKNAAKSLVALFRELKPSMLAKKERGRGADLGKELEEFGAADFKYRVDGVELLEEAIRQGKTGSESDDEDMSADEDVIDDKDMSDDVSYHEASDTEQVQHGDVDKDSEAGAMHDGEVCDPSQGGSGADGENNSSASEKGSEDDDEDHVGEAGDNEIAAFRAAEPAGDCLSEEASNAEASEDASSDDEPEASDAEATSEGSDGVDLHLRKEKTRRQARARKPQQQQQVGSLKQLKQQLQQAAAAKAALDAKDGDEGMLCEHRDDSAVGGGGGTEGEEQAAEENMPLEQTRVLTQEDFERIRKLKIKRMVEQALATHGLKSASQRAKMKEQLYEEMEEALEEQEAMEGASDRRLDPTRLLGKRRGRADKAERMASVMAGREDREAFGSSISRKKMKAGGLTNLEKQKKKALPAMAMKQQAANRKKRQQQRNNPKHHRGRASRGAWD